MSTRSGPGSRAASRGPLGGRDEDRRNHPGRAGRGGGIDSSGSWVCGRRSSIRSARSGSEFLSEAFSVARPVAVDNEPLDVEIGFPPCAAFNKRKAEARRTGTGSQTRCGRSSAAPLNPTYVDPRRGDPSAEAAPAATAERVDDGELVNGSRPSSTQKNDRRPRGRAKADGQRTRRNAGQARAAPAAWIWAR